MLSAREESQALSDQWRSLRRSATFVAVLSAPAAFIWLWKSQDMALGWAIVAPRSPSSPSAACST